MAGLERYNAKAVAQRVGNDTAYGGGQDGTVVISTNTSLTRDMYYNNLTINSGIHLNTNGWKVFVKGTLTLTGTIGIKSTDSAVSGTSLAGHTAPDTAVTYSIGGSTQTNTATQLPTSLFYDIDKAISGYYVDSAATARVIQGGAGGPTGAAGTLDTNVAAPTTWTGKAGTAGSAGAAGALGQHPPAAHTVGSPGGRGYTGGTGGTGTDGTAGTAGTSGTAGTGGTGGNGGAIVLIAAKTVVGSGTIFSQGKTGASGGTATAGSVGTAGSDGSVGGTGSAGADAPGQAYAAHVNNYHHTRPAWHGGGDTHTTHLPHFHNPHYHTHGYKHTDHYVVWTGHAALGAPPHAHSHNPQHNAAAIPADHFSHRGGVNHDHYHSHNPTGGTHGGFAHMYDHGHHGHSDPGTHQNTKFNHEHFGHRYHQVATAWSAGPALHSFHYHATKPGGAGGAGGAGGPKGLAGPGGRAGTPTDGTAGAPGGGGGFILVTETTPSSVVYNTAGTTSGGYTSSNGMQIVVLNA